jgi:hypothetical protein
MQVYSGYTRLKNLGNGLCLTVPGGSYTNSGQLTYVTCTDPTARDVSLPQPGSDQRMYFAGATSKCVDLDGTTDVQMHVSDSVL